jgi:hypothetical protein
MKLNCPECATPIPAENINIQKMAAVCPSCGAVFQFEPAEPKNKRRKVHQPQNLELHDTDDRLQMAFRTNFRLSQDASFISSALMSLLFTFTTVMMVGGLSGEVSSGEPLIGILPASFALGTLLMYYWLASTIYNKTHIEMNDEKISISRKPLPVFEQKNDVSLAGVTVIRYEETPVSKKEGYDLPRFNVWAETPDGSRRMIVKDVIEDYAVFIAQRLNERLAFDSDPDVDVDVARLMDDDTAYDFEDNLILIGMLHASFDQRRKG